MIDWTVSQMWAMDDIFNIWTFITWMFWTLIYHPIWSPVRRAIKFEKRLQIDYEVDLAVDLDFELYIYIYMDLCFCMCLMVGLIWIMEKLMLRPFVDHSSDFGPMSVLILVQAQIATLSLFTITSVHILDYPAVYINVNCV